MELKESREKIDKINEEIIRLFIERMNVSLDVAKYKSEHGLPVFDAAREREIIARVRSSVPRELAGYAAELFSSLMRMSSAYQRSAIHGPGDLSDRIKDALERTPKIFPTEGVVACQGVEGAYSQLACLRLFSYPTIEFVPRFEDVLKAVDSGECRYGVLPIENSSFGSVSEVYDLMKRYRFFIARSIRLRIAHNLLAKKGAKLSDIREITSHSQAIGQCSRFLSSLDGVKITECRNTAVAAKTVAESERSDIAAISSRECASLYGLSVLDSSISDSDNNYTRFICVSREMEIYPGASRISMITELEHSPGTLHAMLSRFATLGLNLTKLESRPIPGRDFEFKFYFDLEASVYSDELLALLDDLARTNESFVFLGSYTEI